MMAYDEEFGSGWQKWNLQAWFDHWTIKLMMTKVSDVIPKTYVPILRLVSEDAGKVDDRYRAIVALREPIHFFDSPRDKWRKTYGSYVRELEWVYGELRQHFPPEEYQELVVDIMARAIRDALGAFLPNVEKLTRGEKSTSKLPSAPGRRTRGAGRFVEKLFNGRFGAWLMNHLNPVSGIVGPVEMKMVPGGMEMYIPRCWMHTAPGDGRTQDEACLYGCKGACEAVFNGRTPVAMLFEPCLPDYDCTLSVKFGEGAVRAA